MSSEIALKAADNIASDYDRYVRERNWIGPEAVFSLLKSYISRGQNLLDIGIGTGLCSIEFHKAGLKIYGIDGSSEMLKVCKKKKITQELLLADLTRDKLPFEGKQFDFIISYGVFHIIGFIENIIAESMLRLNDNGKIVFSIVENNSFLKEKYTASHIQGIYEHTNTFGISNYCHDDFYIKKLIDNYDLELLNKKTILAFKDVFENHEFHFSIYVCKKITRNNQLLYAENN
jgi:predicted TPR repeat methyltransferase